MNFIMHQHSMAKQTISVLIIVSLIIYGTTIQSSDTEGRIIESIIYPDTGIQLKYYPNGFPKYAIEKVKPGIIRTTEWYPDGVIKARKVRLTNCHAPFYIEEWYKNGIKKKEEYIFGYMCNIDSSFFGFIDKDRFALHVFSMEELSTFTCPSPSTGRDTSISVLGSSENPIISWYESGRIESICIELNDKGVLIERYSEEGLLDRRGYFYKGNYFDE